jgi:hypothetical protein
VAEPRSASRRLLPLLVAASLVLGAFVGLSSPARAAPYPALPIADDSTFLSNLSGPDLAPGNSGSIGFHVADPTRFASMTGVTLTLDVYAFNAFPGNATSSVAAAGTPVLVTPTGSGTVVNLSLPSLTAGTGEAGSVGVATATNTPTGTFAVRTALAFVANGTGYRLESRGWFAASLWDAATTLPNGSVTLNLSMLGVSGVTAETSILVSSSSWDWALALILGAALVLLGAGAFVYFRRESKSSSGAR